MARISAKAVSTCSSVLLLLVLLTGSHGYVRFCYFTNWSQYRENATFTPQDIDPALCTHILYSFGALENNTIVPIEYNDFLLYSQMMSLKKANPSLKVLLAIGGWDANNTHFTHLVSSLQYMNSFAQSTIGYLREHKFDGLDIDWEYPAGRGGPPSDRVGFTTLLQTLKAAFTEEAKTSQLPRLMLTAAVIASIQPANNYYQIDQIGSYLDYINIMAYDLHGSWESTTGIHCALYREVDDCVTGWLNAGAPREKLVLGVAAYGRTYTLASTDPNPLNSGLGQLATGPGSAGAYTRSNGSLAYYEICNAIQRDNWTEVYSAQHDSPMAYGRVGNSINWVGYDNVLSIREKAKYIRDRGLAGSLIWSLDFDDFRNMCGENRFPLSSALLEQLPSDGEITTSTEQAVTTTQEPTTTEEVTTTTTEEITTTTMEPTTTTQEPSTTEEVTTTTEEVTTTIEEVTTTTTSTEKSTTSQTEATTNAVSTSDARTNPSTEKATGLSDDSTTADPGWVTTTPLPTTTTSTTVTTPEVTTRRPLFKKPRIPLLRPVRPSRCSLRFADGDPNTVVPGNPRMFVARNFGMISIVCTCPKTFVYNPCLKRCDFETNRATCSRWL